MRTDDQINREELLALTTEIVSSYVSNNTVAAGDVPALIETIFQTLSNIDNAQSTLDDRPQPAVPINRSITPDYLICLEDGKKLKMLKRHLRSAYDMTPKEYRERWGLPADYPMVAPNYAQHRSALARESGLGTRG